MLEIMKDKEKQIEEMAKDLTKHIDKTIYGVRSSNEREKCATFLVDKGWVKLPKDSVVLSREEFEEKYETSEKFMAVVRELEDLKQNLEDKVVLTKEEYEKYKIIEYMGKKSTTIPAYKLIKTFRGVEEQASKETAEKFAEKLENGIDKLDIILHEDNDEQYVSINQLLEFIDEIAKQFGVEIK